MTVPPVSPTAMQVLADWTFQPVTVGLLVTAAALYGWGMARVRRRHPTHPWSLSHSVSFGLGLAVIAVATMSAIGRYDTTFFWVHMAQHLLLIMVAPALLVHGKPLTLSLHASRNPLHTAIKRLLRSRVVTIVTAPLVAIPLYAAVVVGTHLTSFNNTVVLNPEAAAAERLAYLVIGYLYLLSGFGDEPIRWRLSRPAKMVVILLTMPIDTFTGIILLMAEEELWPAYASLHRAWGPDSVTDIHWGGAMMWIGGDIIMIILILVAAVGWITQSGVGRSRMRWVEQARRANLDRYRADVADVAADQGRSDIDEDDRHLAAYNAWLAHMAEQDRGLRR